MILCCALLTTIDCLLLNEDRDGVSQSRAEFGLQPPVAATAMGVASYGRERRAWESSARGERKGQAIRRSRQGRDPEMSNGTDITIHFVHLTVQARRHQLFQQACCAL